MNIETYLPVFPGFYKTIFESDDEDVDFHVWKNDVAEECCAYVAKHLTRILKTPFEIVSQDVWSPREYNVHNDIMNCEITFESYEKITAYLKKEEVAFFDYLKDRFTSYDGFASNYPVDTQLFINGIAEDQQIFHSCIDFILRDEDANVEEEMRGSLSNELYREI